MIYVLFIHVVCKTSNFNKWTAKHLAQASCTELTFYITIQFRNISSFDKQTHKLWTVNDTTMETPWKDTSETLNWNLSGWNARESFPVISLSVHSVHEAVICSILSYILDLASNFSCRITKYGKASNYLFLQKVNSTLLLCQLGSGALLPLGQLQSAYRPTTHR